MSDLPALGAGGAADLAALRALLSFCGLPAEDLSEVALADFRLAFERKQLVGSVGLEVLGEAALLRSLAVASSLRNTGLGARLLDAAETHARTRGVRRLYLLTTTAADYFARRGFARIDRTFAPAPILATREFAALCPASAVCMEKLL